MGLDEIKVILNQCDRQEVLNRDVGDKKVYWRINDMDVADGYYGKNLVQVNIVGGLSFQGDHARELMSCGTFIDDERSDTTAANETILGETMMEAKEVRHNIFEDREM